MGKSNKSGGLMTRFFKFLFQGKVNAIERALQDDPILKQKIKEIHEDLDELTEYVEDNFGEKY